MEWILSKLTSSSSQGSFLPKLRDPEALWAPGGRGSQGIPNQLKPLSETILYEQPFPRP